MVYFVGAGPGAEDLITVRGERLIRQADQIIYAGSLVNPALLAGARADCRVLDSSAMTLEECVERIRDAERRGWMSVRLHTGDPSIYGAIAEQIERLEAEGISWEIVPGVSSMFGAAAALGCEFTVPSLTQSVIITRGGRRTPLPEGESIRSFAAHGVTMVIFLSTEMAEEITGELLAGGCAADTPAAVVYHATWPDQRLIHCTVGTLGQAVRESGLYKTALLIVGRALAGAGSRRSHLYHPAFSTAYRQASEEESDER